MALTIFLLFIFFSVKLAETLTYCQSGTFEFKPPLGGREVCELCLDGTFMPYYDHRYRECFKCSKIRDHQLEVLISECNGTHDAVIQCVSGYYRRRARNPRENNVCLKCTECHYPYFQVQPCQVYDDTGCCPGENFDTELHNGVVPVCRERSWLCRRGQYFSDELFECMPCPNNTFLSLDYHSMRNCWDCGVPLGALHSEVIQPCNSTHPPIIGCEAGYFINSSMGHRKNAIGCSPCTICSTTNKKYEGRQCDQLHDTVCCPEPGMTVVEMTDGPMCQASRLNNFQMTRLPETTKVSEELNRGSHEQLNECIMKCQNNSLGTSRNAKNHSEPTFLRTEKDRELTKLNSEKISVEDDMTSQCFAVFPIFALSLALNIFLVICHMPNKYFGNVQCLGLCCCVCRKPSFEERKYGNNRGMKNYEDQPECSSMLKHDEKAGPFEVKENVVELEVLKNITLKSPKQSTTSVVHCE